MHSLFFWKSIIVESRNRNDPWRERRLHTHSNKYNKQMPPAKEGGIFWRKKTMSVNRQNFVLVDIRHDHVISLLMNLKGSIWKGLRIISCKVLDLFCQHIVHLLVIHYRKMIKGDDLAFIASHTLTKQYARKQRLQENSKKLWARAVTFMLIFADTRAIIVRVWPPTT